MATMPVAIRSLTLYPTELQAHQGLTGYSTDSTALCAHLCAVVSPSRRSTAPLKCDGLRWLYRRVIL